MSERERIQARLDVVLQRLDMYYKAEAAILEGAQSYQIGSRQLTRATLPRVQEEIQTLEKRKEELETALATGVGEKRKSYRVLYRDL